jgi:hypothetical protein
MTTNQAIIHFTNNFNSKIIIINFIKITISIKPSNLIFILIFIIVINNSYFHQHLLLVIILNFRNFLMNLRYYLL